MQLFRVHFLWGLGGGAGIHSFSETSFFLVLLTDPHLQLLVSQFRSAPRKVENNQQKYKYFVITINILYSISKQYGLLNATSRKVTGSIPDGVIGIFHWHNPSGRAMGLGLTQPLTEMSSRKIPWVVKAAGAQG